MDERKDDKQTRNGKLYLMNPQCLCRYNIKNQVTQNLYTNVNVVFAHAMSIVLVSYEMHGMKTAIKDE